MHNEKGRASRKAKIKYDCKSRAVIARNKSASVDAFYRHRYAGCVKREKQRGAPLHAGPGARGRISGVIMDIFPLFCSDASDRAYDLARRPHAGAAPAAIDCTLTPARQRAARTSTCCALRGLYEAPPPAAAQVRGMFILG